MAFQVLEWIKYLLDEREVDLDPTLLLIDNKTAFTEAEYGGT